ncbi:MAG: LCP family protein, partial [Streptococcus mitis]|nr:LCP family protein [Streptococcus mitis]
MSKENPLSHHEQLRYDYLFKNIHYLNEREKKEFAYLQDKLSKASSDAPAESQELTEDYRKPSANTSIPSYNSRSRSERYQKINSLSKKKTKNRKLRWSRIFVGLLALLTFLALGMIFMFLKGYTNANPDKTTNARAAQVEVFNGQDTRDGVNILIMGTDGRIGQNSAETRTDSIMVLNVGGSDKKMKLVSFMRDNLIYIDGYSQVINGRKQTDNKLNVAYELGEQEGQKGAEMVRQVLKDNFDLDIKYYALVDFQAFATAIDTLFPDGVTIDAQFSTLNGLPLTEATVGDDLHATETESPTQTIKVGKQQMNGSTLLNYARFRDDDEADYGRTKRQQQVLTALLQQIKDPTKLFTGSEALGKVFAMTSTNVPYTFLLTNGLSFLDGVQNGIEKLTIP